MNGKRFSEDKARRNGFYLALAVCLVAVGIAAWSTYDAVQGYMEPEDAGTSLSQQQADVSSQQRLDEDPQAHRGAAKDKTGTSSAASASRNSR